MKKFNQLYFNILNEQINKDFNVEQFFVNVKQQFLEKFNALLLQNIKLCEEVLDNKHPDLCTDFKGACDPDVLQKFLSLLQAIKDKNWSLADQIKKDLDHWNDGSYQNVINTDVSESEKLYLDQLLPYYILTWNVYPDGIRTNDIICFDREIKIKTQRLENNWLPAQRRKAKNALYKINQQHNSDDGYDTGYKDRINQPIKIGDKVAVGLNYYLLLGVVTKGTGTTLQISYKSHSSDNEILRIPVANIPDRIIVINDLSILENNLKDVTIEI